MKKTASLFISFLLVIMLAGCAAPATNSVVLDDYRDLPWQSSRSFSSETSTYKVTDYVLGADGKTAITDDDSYLKFTLTQSKLNTGTEDAPVEITVLNLKTDFMISYKGSTEKSEIHSESTFKRDGLYAISTVKEVVTPSASYYFEADYDKGEAKYATTKEQFQNGETRTLTFTPGNYIDNEIIYYYIRAMKGLTDTMASSSTFSQEFAVVNWFECFNKYQSFHKGELVTSEMAVTSVKSLSSQDYWENVKVEDPDILLGFDDEFKLTENNELKSHYVAIMLTENGRTKGQPFYAYYAQGAYKGGENIRCRNILTKMVTYYSRGEDLQKEPPEFNNAIEFVLSDFESK